MSNTATGIGRRELGHDVFDLTDESDWGAIYDPGGGDPVEEREVCRNRRGDLEVVFGQARKVAHWPVVLGCLPKNLHRATDELLFELSLEPFSQLEHGPATNVDLW